MRSSPTGRKRRRRRRTPTCFTRLKVRVPGACLQVVRTRHPPTRSSRERINYQEACHLLTGRWVMPRTQVGRCSAFSEASSERQGGKMARWNPTASCKLSFTWKQAANCQKHILEKMRQFSEESEEPIRANKKYQQVEERKLRDSALNRRAIIIIQILSSFQVYFSRSGIESTSYKYQSYMMK